MLKAKNAALRLADLAAAWKVGPATVDDSRLLTRLVGERVLPAYAA